MKILESLDLRSFGINESDLEILGSSLIITKKNWDYLSCLSFQEKVAELIAENKSESVFIFCSHPTLLTMGRGLQKAEDLIEFDNSLRDNLEVPIFDISRGGGITFHHLDQFIFYPIISLEFHHKKVMDYMTEILKTVKDALSQKFFLNDFDENRKLLGLWFKDKKIASIGLCTRRFVTFHGLALNLSISSQVINFLSKIYPCGLSMNTYIGLDEIVDNDSEEVFNLLKEALLQQFIKKVQS